METALHRIRNHGIVGLAEVVIYLTKGNNFRVEFRSEVVPGRAQPPHRERIYLPPAASDERILHHPAVQRCTTYFYGQNLVTAFRTARDQGVTDPTEVKTLKASLEASFGKGWVYRARMAQFQAGAWLSRHYA